MINKNIVLFQSSDSDSDLYNFYYWKF